MKENKKLVIGIIVFVLIIAAIVSTILIINYQNEKKVEQSNIEEENGVSKLEDIVKKMEENKNYKISLTLNKDNSRTTSKKGDMTKIEINDEGEKNTYLIKDNTTYLLVDENKKYYEYKNNVSLTNDFENKASEVLGKMYTVGKEKIDGKEYRYEEFGFTNAFLINYKGTIDGSDVKTRLYFDGNDLKYVKTYVGDVEQLLKVELTFDNQKDSDFEIPQEYSKK